MERIFLYIVKFFYKISFKNYLREISLLLNKNLKKNFTLLDIGAANGFNEKWNLISKRITLILVEPHEESAIKLKKNGFEVIKSVLNSEDNKKINFYSTKKPECSSFLKPNFQHLNKFSNKDRFEIISQDTFNSYSLDTVIKNFSQPNFIKIDTEGSELEILKGSTQTLTNIFGLEVECSFNQLREDQPLFEDIRSYLKNFDFEFIDFVSMIRWEKDNFRFFGQPQITDVLFLKNEELIIQKFKNDIIKIDDLINYFLILIVYERVDILKYVYEKSEVTLDYIEKIIKILDKKTNKLNNLKQAQYFIEHQNLQMYKIGIITRPFGIYSDSLKKLNNFFKIKLYKKKKRPNKKDLIKFAIDCDGLIAGGEIYDRAVLNSLPRLKIISRAGIGIDNIDIKHAKLKKIAVFNTPDAPSNSTAEFAFSLILNSIKKIYILGQNVKKKDWTRIHHYEFSNLNVGLIGCGRISSRVLKLLIRMPFNQIFVNDTDKKKYKIKNKKIVYTSKFNIFKKADIISFHVPSTLQTRNLFNKKNIILTKKEVAAVNTARGEIINIRHLEEFIKKNHFSTVALDVMPVEPYFGPLLKYKNCIITPHNSSMSFTSRKNMELGSVKNLMSF